MRSRRIISSLNPGAIIPIERSTGNNRLDLSLFGHHNDGMKNKNKVSKKNEKLIANIREMVNQFTMAGDEFKSWREAWMEVISTLEAGGSI